VIEVVLKVLEGKSKKRDLLVLLAQEERGKLEEEIG